MSDPKGINYPQDKELRLHLAAELRKLQSEPARQEAVEKADQWPEYAAAVVASLEAAAEAEEK